MIVNKLEPNQSLSKAYLKIKPDRESIAAFKANLTRLINLIDDQKDEEFNKNFLIDFLRKTYYGDRYFINTKERSDLAIHNDKGADSQVGVIFETKKPTKTGSAEMPRLDDLNRKAFQQLVLYFLRERVTHENIGVKHLVVTNIYEWFIFDAKIFEDLFYNDIALKKKFVEFQEKRLGGDKTDFFYKEIAKPAIAKVIDQIKFTHFDLRDYVDLDKGLKPVVLDNGKDADLIDLYKIFSPEHLLKLRPANDSNSLNKPFYNELLYIIGLTEIKDKGKKLIGRRAEGDRYMGSLIENAINELDSSDKISQLEKPEEFGETDEERLFNVALRLSITWINRVLFLKLLEAQLLKYHDHDQDFAFLNLDKVKSYGDLNRLFFSVLAREHGDRIASVKETFANVPYLNSSLFELTDIEQKTISISNLASENLPIFGATVLIDGNERKRSGELNGLAYLFEFLHAYKFSKDEFEDTQEDSEKLINASVLGLIFEKINGYKDGSFYTPSFITMYMCRETIRRAVVQKFNEVMGWSCENIQDLKDDLGIYIKKADRVVRRNEANGIVNSLKICDPAVGSGHFLVSALNEMIAIKQYLGVLQDQKGEVLSQYEIEVVNDKLKVTLDNKLFAYNPKNKESQRIQETLFHEKQSIIEGCLFGVDINPNSVTICRLRLWIELLKNAYYRVDGNLETLPNIDINIKCGNSLISRFGLDVDVKQVLQKQKFSIEQYRNAVQTYRSAESKAQKREMESLIAKIKDGFSSSLLAGDPKKVKLRQLQAELYGVENQMLLLEETKAEVKAREKRVNKLNNEIDKLTAEIEDIESGRLYENALEWRFEFPEVLNDDGDFIGFDVLIGNPPYGVKLNKQEDSLFRQNYQVSNYQIDTYTLFTELGIKISSPKFILCFIIPNTWYASIYDTQYRKYLIDNKFINSITTCPVNTFDDAVVETCILECIPKNNKDFFEVYSLKKEELNKILFDDITSNERYSIGSFSKSSNFTLTKKIIDSNEKVNDYFDVIWGIKVYEKGKGNPPQTGNESQQKIFHSAIRLTPTHKPLIGGSEIFPYKLSWKGGFVNYGEWIAAPRKPIWFEASPRIVVREVTSKGNIFATLIFDEYVFSNSVDGIKSKSNNIQDLEILVAILNSKFAQFFHLNKSGNSSKDTFPKILLQDLREFPFPKGRNNFEKISIIVNEILTAKKGDRHADTSGLEKECDRLVYKLYQLTYEEVKIIDPEFELTEQEYTAIKIE